MDTIYVVWSLVFLSLARNHIVSSCPITCRCENANRNVTCTGLVNEFPRPLPKSTIQLIIKDSTLGDVNRKALEGLKDLKKLWITSSTVRVIHTCSLSNLQNMTSLRLDDVKIERIAGNGFSHFRDIEEISITRSAIDEIMEFAFHDIVKTKLFTIADSKIGKIGTSAFRDFIDVDNFVLSNLSINEIDYAPIKAISGIDQMKITQNSFNSTICGLDTVGNLSQPNTVRSLNFSGNVLPCNVDILNDLLAYEENTVSVTFRNNKCNAPVSVAGKVLNEDLLQTLVIEAVPPSCPPTKTLKDEHSCQMYTLDDPILPPEEVPYPTEKPRNRGNGIGLDRHVPMSLLAILFSFTVKSFD